ncbi:MAG TPA: hypothetical protein VJZ76_00920 [Thermoanaerobaculia bacterium]|nr:hypothetical protein [Thermoanaerobaculia bacterium]
MASIILAKGGSGDLAWQLVVGAEKTDGLWRGKDLEVRGNAGAVAKAELQDPIEIPADLVKNDAELKTPGEITSDLLLAARAEFTRRFSRLDLTWSSSGAAFFGLTTPFGGASGALASFARVNLAQILGPEMDAQAPLVECVLLAAADATFTLNGTTTTAKAAIGAIVVLRADDARFRIDLADIDFGLPEFKLPKLTLPDVSKAEWPGAAIAAARTFERLLRQTGITITVTPVGDTPVLLLKDLGTATPKWTIVQTSDNTKLQEFEVVVKSGGNDLFKVEHLTAGYVGNALQIAGTVTAQKTVPINDGEQPLGPLQLRWKGIEVTSRFEQPISGGRGPNLSAEVSFQSIVLSAREEPEVTLELRGTVVISPDGISITKLDVVVGADAVKLLTIVEKLAKGIYRILASGDPGDGNLPNVLPKLLSVLARLAAAAARVVGFVGEIIGKLLVGIARAVGKLLEAVAALMNDAAQNLIFDIRLTLDPLEIVQIVVVARHDAVRTKTVSAKAGGLRVELNQTWQPALLIDFVVQPGVYLVALPVKADKAIGSLSTDLWLARGNEVSPVRDADGQSGQRADTPLFQLLLDATQLHTIVLAGLRRGQPLFLHRLDTPDKTITLGGVPVTVCDKRLEMTPLTNSDLGIHLNVEKKRVLSLLGLGDDGEKPDPHNFFDKLQQVIWIEEVEKEPDFQARTLTIGATLVVKLGDVQTSSKVKLTLALNDLSFSLASAGTVLKFTGDGIDQRALGLQWIVKPNSEKTLFDLTFDGPTTTLKKADGATMELRYTDLSSDGRGLVFDVTMFRAGRAGIDLDATIAPQSVRLNGLDVPFHFTAGALRLRNGKLVEASVSGKGKLPPDLVGDAGASIALVFTQRDGNIELQSGTARIDKAGEPIVCHATRFTLTISNLGLDFVREDGQVHFYFVVTGSLQFTPKPGEFSAGLLKFLKDARMNLEKVPLAGDARVLARHISFQIALKPKLRVNLFDLFSFELRGIGFHPSSPKFDGKPAMNVSGQISFAEIGDVMHPKIDFHGLWIAPPRDGESLPRIKADGLGVDIGLPGTARISGTVVAVDERLTTLEGTELAPPEYKTYGFLGDGRLALEGFATLAASFGFLEIELPNNGGRKKTFFLFVQQERIAVEIPTPVWTLYLREVGFGFGYRYTLEGIKAAERAGSVAELIRTLDDVSTRQGELASFAAWRPDPEKDNVTLALRGALQFAPAEKKYDAKKEKKTPNPFFFDLIAALRSDMTFLMSLRGWPFTNYFDFAENTDDLRTNPFFTGYLYISAPRQEFLARFRSDPKGYIGRNPLVYPQIELALRAVEFSATLYIRPGLLHYELGWPDQLKVTLFDEPNFRAQVRGGMVFRVWDSALLTGYNIEADAFLRIGGQAGGDSLGVAAEASLSAAFVARFIAYLDFSDGRYLFYGLASLDACLTIRVSAWLRIDLRFTSFKIELGFSFSIQLSVALELAIAEKGIGALADVRVAISVFGATFAVRVGFTIGSGELAEARARVQRFMAMSLTADAPEPSRIEAAKSSNAELKQNAAAVEKSAQAPATTPVPEEPKKGNVIGYAQLGDPIPATDFWLVLRRMPPSLSPLPDKNEVVLATLIPRDGRFYAGGTGSVRHKFRRATAAVKVKHLKLDRTTFEDFTLADQAVDVKGILTTELPGSDHQVTLQSIIDACFLIDAKVGNADITVLRRTEPPLRKFAPATQMETSDERDRAAKLNALQRAFNAETAREGEVVTSVRDARTTLLARFVEQFKAFADTGAIPPAGEDIHLADLGLIFAMTPDDAVTFANELKVQKSDVANSGDEKSWGSVTLLNPPNTWFDRSDPILQHPRATVDVEGIKLHWVLQHAWSKNDDPEHEPEHFLDHYEIVRVIETRETERFSFDVKPCSNPGQTTDGVVELHKTELRFTDDLADVPPQVRRVLLPRGGPEAAAPAVADWLELFPDRDEITVTYVVTPVDVAGTRGQARAMYKNIVRPDAPIRPATARLVVVVPPEPLATPRALGDTSVPPGLEVYLGISDPHWDNGNPSPQWNHTEVTGLAELHRGYRLIFDPDDIVPSGMFGPGGLSTRRQTPGGADELQRTADETTAVELKRINPEPRKAPDDLELGKERTNFPFWLDISADDVAQKLWSRDKQPQQRVAVRAYLETTLEIKMKSGKSAPLTSRRVPVDIELRIPAAGARANPQALVPAAFEWPVRIDYPPLPQKHVRAHAGLAYFLGPDPAKTSIADPVATLQFLDPLRRSLTQVAWAAAPTAGPQQLVGGYDLYELDLDELAPSDTQGTSLDNDAGAWNRSRRVARVQLLRRSEAMLTPGLIDDPKAWQAHMPSEVWRCDRSDAVKRRGSLPVRKGWFSPRESLLEWPVNVPRSVLLPAVDDAVITALLEHGRPKKLKVSLTVGGETRDVTLVSRKILDGSKNPFDLKTDLSIAADTGVITTGNPLTPEQIRRALMCLATAEPVALVDAVLVITASTEVTIKEVVVDDAGNSTLKDKHETRTAVRTVIVPEDGELHPALAEALDLLRWSYTTLSEDGEVVVYRRYEVVAEPATPLRAKTLDQFLAATDPEKDPYGWTALRTLGLAASLKLHDGDTGDFVKPAELIERARRLFFDALTRYPDAGGSPMLDIFLRPGADRVAGDVDCGPESVENLGPNDEALAFVQLSLRPKPLQSFRYSWVAFDNPEAPVKVRLGEAIIGDVVIYGPAEQRIVRLSNDASEETLAKLPKSLEPVIRLLIRHPSEWADQTEQFKTLFPGIDNIKVTAFRDPLDADEQLKKDEFDAVDTVYDSGAFAELDAAVIAELLGKQKRAERSSLASFVQRAARIPEMTVPDGWAKPEQELKVADVLPFATPYAAWLRRFLEHGLTPKQTSGFSFCAPVVQQPWKLAAALDGSLTLSFLHEDRYAHARAYAVRPVGRYHEQAVAVRGIDARDGMERVLPENSASNVEIGHAIAVSPRTARLETPTILSSRMVDEAWHLVVARHHEQDLILSNRSLFARLGFEGVALTWVQEYRERAWPEGLAKLLDDHAFFPDYAVAPPLRRPTGDDLTKAPRLVDADLIDAAKNDKALWKGAEIVRVPRLPHHLRTTALATARAGAVVSSISYATQQDFAYRLPDALAKRFAIGDDGNPNSVGIPAPTWSLVKRDNKAVLCFRFSALSYADVMPEATFTTWVTKGKDVAYWPDPGIAYVFVRESKGMAGKTALEEEAQVNGVVPDKASATVLLALRARGPSWQPAADVEIKNVAPADKSPLFEIAACVEAVAFTPRSVVFDDAVDPATWPAFLAAAGNFVALRLIPPKNEKAVMTLTKLPTDEILDAVEALTGETDRKLAAHFRQVVRDAVLDGAERWLLRAEKGRATPQFRTIESPRWSKP